MAAVAILATAACKRPPPEAPTVAKLGDEVIRAPDLKAELDRVRAESAGEIVLEGERFVALRRAVLDGLVEQRLLLAEAKRQGITVGDKELDEALARRHEGGVEAEPGTSPLPQQALRERTRDQLLIDKLLLKEVVARVAVGPDDARTYYEQHLEEFSDGEQVRAAQILVPTREEAEAVRRELNRGTDFGKVAREHSSSPDAQAGGDLGWFAKGTMPPEFDAACFALQKGQVSEVVQSPYGFHLFKLVDRRAPSVQPFAQVERVIELRLRREAVAKAQAAYVDKLRQKVEVAIFDGEVDKVL